MTKRLSLFLAIALVLVALGYGAYSLGRTLQGEPEIRGTRFQNAVDVSNVTLTNAEDAEVALSSYAGKHTLVFFGFTRCPDVCPVTLARMAEAYRNLGEPDNVQVVMISVDPSHDTPERTQAYAAGFHPDFVGLSGSNAQVAEAAKTFYIGFQAAAENTAHTDALILVNPEGELEAVYSQDNLRYLQEDLERLLDS